ncbi:MAG: 3'-5' exonuclease [Bacteroidales bacterium]
MLLNLKNPVVFFDLEATGLNVGTDGIVEISAIKVLPNGETEEWYKRIFPYNSYTQEPIPMGEEAQKIHGISIEDLKECPTFKQIAKDLAAWLKGCDLAGYNSNKFDIPLLAEEFIRAGVDFDFRKRKMIDVQNIFHKMEQRTLVAAYKFYCQKDLRNAHSASADTLATYEVLKAQLDRYPFDSTAADKTKKNPDELYNGDYGLKNDTEFLAKFSRRNNNVDLAGRMIYNKDNIPVFNFGKYKNQPVLEVLKKDHNFYAWMMKGTFTLETKKVLTDLYIQSKTL